MTTLEKLSKRFSALEVAAAGPSPDGFRDAAARVVQFLGSDAALSAIVASLEASLSVPGLTPIIEYLESISTLPEVRPDDKRALFGLLVLREIVSSPRFRLVIANLGKCLNVDPDKPELVGPAIFQRFAAPLRNYLEEELEEAKGLPTPARPSGRFAKWWERRSTAVRAAIISGSATVLAAFIGAVVSAYFAYRAHDRTPEPTGMSVRTPSLAPLATSPTAQPRSTLPAPGLTAKTPRELTESLAGVPVLMRREAAQKLLGSRVAFEGELQPAGGMNGGRFEMFVWEVLPSGAVNRSSGIGFFVDDVERYPGIQTLKEGTRIHVEGIVGFADASSSYRLHDVKLRY